MAATESSLLARDRIDSGRIASPLTMAEGAVHIDSTPYTLEEVVDLIVGLVGGVEMRRRRADHPPDVAAARRAAGRAAG